MFRNKKGSAEPSLGTTGLARVNILRDHDHDSWIPTSFERAFSFLFFVFFGTAVESLGTAAGSVHVF